MILRLKRKQPAPAASERLQRWAAEQVAWNPQPICEVVPPPGRENFFCRACLWARPLHRYPERRAAVADALRGKADAAEAGEGRG